ncbi:serine/threonine receptor-like kinase NFP [Impatiens glandulifera]|uniref:serine/threonine receptor-like kinase NFP n=1 Tax=Impatiens glandulifera TaxID=253017 RepID=UPI001FB13F76|nr:serine/threonine receptor-like kinase NFP [Impatiens glandulifera]
MSPFVFFAFLFVLSPCVTSQSSDTLNAFSCSSKSRPSCNTYVTYRARGPRYLNLQTISALFGIDVSEIANASNLYSLGLQIFPQQLLLIPITCNCNGSYYFHNVSYKIQEGDSFFKVSISNFENLTDFHTVQDMNPSLNPTNLSVGAEAIFPLLCQCPTKSQMEYTGVSYLITYVWQPDDDIFPVSAMFNTTPDRIVSVNNYRNLTASICLPMLIPVSRLPVFSWSPSFGGRHKPSHKLVLIFAVISVFLFGILLVYVRIRSKKKKVICRFDSCLETPDIIQTSLEKKSVQEYLLPGVSGYLGKPIVFDLKVIMEATMNLDKSCRIGRSIYRAVIDGKTFAVKKAKDVSEEFIILQRLNHSNLVKLMGISSSNSGLCFLVHEYAEKGSLNEWLYKTAGFLSWSQRLNVMLDVASGLQYMHEHNEPSIVHRDIRTSNILLDSNFKAKVGNFSKARRAATSAMLKIDVFAFGIVLLELLSGKKGMETRENGEVVMLWKEVRAFWEDKENREEKMRKWMDPVLERFYPPIDLALRLAGLAKACTSEKPWVRPSMGEVVFNLSVLLRTQLETSCASVGETDEPIRIMSPVLPR